MKNLQKLIIYKYYHYIIFKDKFVIGLSIGIDHSLAWDINGRLYAWGSPVIVITILLLTQILSGAWKRHDGVSRDGLCADRQIFFSFYSH